MLRNPVLSASGTVNLETEHSRTVFSEATSSGLIDNKDSLCSTPPESSVTATRTVVPLSNIDTKCKDCEFCVCFTNTAKLCDSQLSAAAFCVPQVAHSETLHDVLFCISQDIQLDTGMFSGRTVSSRDIKLSPVDIKDSDFASSKLGWKSTGTVSVQPVDLYDCFSPAHSEQQINPVKTVSSEPAPQIPCAQARRTAAVQHPPAPVSVSQMRGVVAQLVPAPVSSSAEGSGEPGQHFLVSAGGSKGPVQQPPLPAAAPPLASMPSPTLSGPDSSGPESSGPAVATPLPRPCLVRPAFHLLNITGHFPGQL